MLAIASKKKFSTAGVLFAVILFAGIVIAGLYVDSNSTGDRPRVLRISVLPDQNPQALQQQYGPLAAHLGQQLDGETRLVVPASYHDAIRLFREGKVDLAYFGGLTFVQAQTHYGAEPLVMREIDTRFASWFLVNSEHSQRQLSDFRGKRLGFGSKLSTSGHLMPRHFLKQQWQIDAESYFSEVSYAGAHDQTVLRLRAGEIDVGAVNSLVAKQMIADGRIAASAFQVLWQTPPYADYVWAVRANLHPKLKARLRDAFLSLDMDDPGDAVVLAALGAKIYLPADPNDFETLRDIATRLELMDPEFK